MSEDNRVVVVTGLGGMGLSVAQRLGLGSKVVLADVNQAALEVTAESLRADGYDVVEQMTDVSNRDSVAALAGTRERARTHRSCRSHRRRLAGAGIS